MSAMLQAPLATAAIGLLHGLMACATWLALRGPRPAPVLHLWAAGTLTLGLGMVASGLAGSVPPPLSGPLRQAVAATLMLVGPWLRLLALRHEPGQRASLVPGITLIGLSLLGWWACLQVPDQRVSASYGNAVLAVCAALTGRQAWIAGRRRGARTVRWLAAAEWLLMAALVLRALALTGEPPAPGLVWWLPLAAAALSALFGNLGFLGMAMDEQHRAELKARQARIDATASREAAEQTAHALQALLVQRDDLAGEREALLQMLAHEIRAPLQQAEQALDDAVQVLRDPRDASAAQVQGRLQQAQAVLGEVRAVLDNTLTAATLLSRATPLVRQPVALDFLVELTLGDLAADQRDRLTVEWLTDIDTLQVEPGLVRLALRNLLHNAFLHGGPRVQVSLRLEEVPAIHGLRLVVADDGPGIAAHRLHRHQVDGTAARRKLGLDVVRQVMALHGGQLVLGNMLPRGFAAQLVFPLPAANRNADGAYGGTDGGDDTDDFADGFDDGFVDSLDDLGADDVGGGVVDDSRAGPGLPARQAVSSGARNT